MYICVVIGFFCFFHCLICIHGDCVSSVYSDSNITAVVGQSVIFKCEQLAGCPRYVWRIFPANAIPHVDILDDSCNTNYKVCATENRNGRKVLRLTDVSENSAEYYQCSCAYPNRPPTAFSCNQLIVVCQAQVTVRDLLMTFNGSHTGSTETSVIDIPEDELVQVNCLGLSTFTTSCSEGSSRFTAARFHNNCSISCQSAKGCTTKIIMNVLNRETTTTSSTHYKASTEAAVHHTAAHIASTKDTDETSAMIFITSLDTHCYVECNSAHPSCYLEIAIQAFNEDDMRTGSMKTPLTTMNSSFPPIFIIISSTSIVFIIVAIVPTYWTVDKTPRTSNSTELDVKGTTANDQVKDGDSCHTSANVEQYYWEPDNVIPTTRSNTLTNQKAAYLDTNDELQLPIGNAICRVDDDTMYAVSDISFKGITHHKQTKSNPVSHFVNEAYMTVTV